MINILFFMSLISIFCLTFFIIFYLRKLNTKVKKLILSSYILEQNIIIAFDKRKIKKTLKPKNSKIELLLMITDIVLTELYPKKYEKLKDLYEFIKNTVA